MQSTNTTTFDQLWDTDTYPDDPSVGLVRLIQPENNHPSQFPVVIASDLLLLDFDILNEEFQYLSLKLFHCNADWKHSLLRDLEFLSVFNEFQIRDYEFSQTNYQDYTHYTFRLPRVTKTGNYILSVYDEDTGNILFTRRFSVYKNAIQLEMSIERPFNVGLRNTHHQIPFEISYGNLNVINPQTDIKTHVIQNHNWGVGFHDLAPSQIRIDQQQLVYENFNDENCLPGWNEFRIFDTRRIANRGLHVSDQYRSEKGAEVVLDTDLSKTGTAYSLPFQTDLNGFYYSSNQDWLESDINSEYTYVHFQLEAPKVSGSVYVSGRFVDWKQSENNQLHYNDATQSYQGEILMKQGFYNYRYELVSSELPSWYFEGSHFQTVNTYELLVYFREPGTVYDQLVGYAIF